MAVITVTGRKPKVSTSDGHGYDTAGKETPNLPQRNGQRMKEKEFNEAVQNYLAVELARCGIDHKDVAPGRSDVPLATRAKASNSYNADLHIDIHANAFNGILNDQAGGIETFYFPSTKSTACAKVLHKHIMNGTKMKDRGLKNGDWLYMLKNTKAPAVLVELGFMDNKYDVEQLLSDAYRLECAVELAKGVCEIFGKGYVAKPVPKPVVPAPAPKPAPTTKGSLYRVVTGSFADRTNANERIKAIKAKGFDSFIDVEKVNGKTTYRVVTGSFEGKANADEQLNKLKKVGFDSFLVAIKQ